MVPVGFSKHNSVRLAERKDIRKLAELSVLFINESQYSFSVDPDKFVNLISSFVDGDDRVCFVLVNELDVPVGMIAALIGSPLFSNNKIAQEIVWYIQEDYRGPRQSLSLLDVYERWAKYKNCEFIQLSNLELLQGDKVEKLYLRKGYTKRESAFLKEIT